MSEMTITEALAEMKTLEKRIAKKRQFVADFLWRPERLKDPLDKQGGSVAAVQEARQSIDDLCKRAVDIRLAIQDANESATITVAGVTKSIAEWLVWRREVAPGQQQFINNMRMNINRMREEAQQKGIHVTATEAASLDDVVVNVDEKALAAEAEQIEEVLGALDGQLSLKNATVTIGV